MKKLYMSITILLQSAWIAMVPATGDHTNTFLYLILFAIAAGLLLAGIVLFIIKKRKK